MLCPKCKKLLSPTALNCFYCGYELRATDRPLASLFRRWLGQFLDAWIAFIVVVAGFFLMFEFRSAPIARFSGTIAGILALLYLWLADGLKNGQSCGKRLLKTSVIDATTGAPCTYAKSFIRNGLLFAPLVLRFVISGALWLRLPLSFLGLADVLFIFGEKRQRLGDKLANTIVIEALPSQARKQC